MNCMVDRSILFRSLLWLALGTVVCGEGMAQTATTFSNPILAGFYPDPSVCRVGSNYYLVNSTFSYFPGIPVFQSKDLVHWDLIAHVLDRPDQLNLDKQGVSRGLFAPTIRYHDGIFYVICTLVDIGGNFVATAKSPGGPWSSPFWIPEINGIDPSLFFDDDGKAYVIYNSNPPDDKPLYDGHRTIRMYEFDTAELKVVGKERLLVNGGTDISKKPVWIEAPHIFKKDGSYFLIAAEGGTADQHSEVVFKSAKVDGPYVPYADNPILTQRHLDPGRKDPITSTGHADFVQTESGDWWAVFLGCRPYPPVKEGYYNTGRETFLAPVRWKDGWPVITAGEERVQYSYPCPTTSTVSTSLPYGGNFTVRDDFRGKLLNPNWVFLRTPQGKWYDFKTRKGSVTLKLRPETCSGNGNPSFLARRQQHLRGSASCALTFTPKAENEKAGLLVFQNETHYYFICKSIAERKPVIQVFKSVDPKGTGAPMELVAAQEIPAGRGTQPVLLKIEARGGTYAFLYGFKGGDWNALKEGVDAKFLSTRLAGGFVGCMYGPYATSLDRKSSTVASFDWFEYAGNDEVYE
jgi:xylan 1,4-beta-xylosidase